MQKGFWQNCVPNPRCGSLLVTVPPVTRKESLMYSRSVGPSPPATYPTLQRSGGNTTLPERLFAHMRKEAQKSTPLPNTSRGLLELLQQEFNLKVLAHQLNTKPLDEAELLYRKLGKIYTILMKLESFQFSNPDSGLLNSVVPQLEVYINALNIDETKRGELSQTVTLIRGVILRSKGEWYTPTDAKRTPVGW